LTARTGLARTGSLIAGALAAAILMACGSPAPRTGTATPRPAPAAVPPPPTAVAAIPDAVPRDEQRSRYGNPPFYEVLGQRYQVLPSAVGYAERGVASWYGPTFHGKNTSSGEPYDMYAMTAAHKTLPIPCYARVTNLRNGRAVIVRINDRGPFVSNRIIDLSWTAAAKLDMLRDGTAFVSVQTLVSGAAPASTAVEPLPSASAAPPVFGPAKSLTLQVGAYASEANALRVVERLKAAGIANAWLSRASDAAALQLVRIGPLASVAEFDQLQSRLGALGLPGARLVTDP
jgi:rare lipoprotein A